MDPKTVNDNIFVKMNMPVVSEIDLRPIVMDFIKKKERKSAKEFDIDQVMKQEYFKTFFPNVSPRKRNTRKRTDHNDWELDSEEEKDEIVD